MIARVASRAGVRESQPALVCTSDLGILGRVTNHCLLTCFFEPIGFRERKHRVQALNVDRLDKAHHENLEWLVTQSCRDFDVVIKPLFSGLHHHVQQTGILPSVLLYVYL